MVKAKAAGNAKMFIELLASRKLLLIPGGQSQLIPYPISKKEKGQLLAPFDQFHWIKGNFHHSLCSTWLRRARKNAPLFPNIISRTNQINAPNHLNDLNQTNEINRITVGTEDSQETQGTQKTQKTKAP
jgi:hypothetical protein